MVVERTLLVDSGVVEGMAVVEVKFPEQCVTRLRLEARCLLLDTRI